MRVQARAIQNPAYRPTGILLFHLEAVVPAETQWADPSFRIWRVAEQMADLSEANEPMPGDFIESGKWEHVSEDRLC